MPSTITVFVPLFLALIGAAVYVAKELATLATEVKNLRYELTRVEKVHDRVDDLEGRVTRLETKAE